MSGRLAQLGVVTVAFLCAWAFACERSSPNPPASKGAVVITPPPPPSPPPPQNAAPARAPGSTESASSLSPHTASLKSGHAHQHAPLEVCRSEGDPLDAARDAYDKGRFAEALSCAAQAAAFYPDVPQAHSERGAALSALGRFEDAQLAYARALALQPDHLDALLGAAHLYAVSLSSSREHDELGVLYAARGLTGAQAQGDARLSLEFALVSAMALNDLGRAQEALAHADLVLGWEPSNKDARYERAVALFELCRFDDAKKAFAAILDDEDRGAHAHHHLGLLLEREGHAAQAERHFALARRRAPEDFPLPQPMDADEFKAEVEKAVASLPEDMRRDLVGVPVAAEELPSEEDLLGGEPPLSPAILGLFRGPPLGERCEPEPGRPCRSVALYRKNLARAVQSREELVEQIRVTLLHEVGHLRGEDDHELAARGLE